MNRRSNPTSTMMKLQVDLTDDERCVLLHIVTDVFSGNEPMKYIDRSDLIDAALKSLFFKLHDLLVER